VSEGVARLLALAERELDLVQAGAWEDLAALAQERAALVATLGAPSPADRPALERLAGRQQLVSAALARAGAETSAELGRLGRGRGAVRGYATCGQPVAPAAGRLDDAA